MFHRYTCLIFFLILVVGCVARQPHRMLEPRPMTQRLPRHGIYHQVKKGQTLWRVAQEYNVTVDELLHVNRIGDHTDLKVGQFLFIPRAQHKIDISVSPIHKHTKITTEKRFKWPVKGLISVKFGQKSEMLKSKGIHLAAPYGRPVKASKTGVVSYRNAAMRGFGKFLMIDHQDGFITVYAFLADMRVKEGDVIKQGQVIGRVGRSVRTRSSMLYFEIRKDARPVDPLIYLN